MSSASSDGENASDEKSPRLARKDEFEQGIGREWTRTREYREQWEEDHIFYKQKIQARLEAEDNEEYVRGSDLSEDAWSGQAEQLYSGTPATSGGVGWSAEWKENWTVEESWDVGKGEDEEFWNSCEKLQRQDSDTVDGGMSTQNGKESSKLCLRKHSRCQLPTVRRQPTHNNANSFSTLSRLPESTRYLYPTSTILHNADTALSPFPPSSQTATAPSRIPVRTSKFRDPEPVIIELAPNSTFDDPSSTFDDGKPLASFLDNCIAKTQVLLVNANEALNSGANVEEKCRSDYGLSKEEKQQYSRSKNATTDVNPESKFQTPQKPSGNSDDSTIAMHESYAVAGPSQTGWQSKGEGPTIKDQATNESQATNSTQALQAMIARMDRIESQGERLETRVQHLENTPSSRSTETRHLPDAEDIVRVDRWWKFKDSKAWREGKHLIHTHKR